MKGVRVLIVGADETGLQLAGHVRAAGGHATVVSDLVAGTRTFRVGSGVITFGRARARERHLRFNQWDDVAPAITGLEFHQVDAGTTRLRWTGRLQALALSVHSADRRIGWANQLRDRGVPLLSGPTRAAEVEALADDHDLVVVTELPSDSNLVRVFRPVAEQRLVKPARHLAAASFDDVTSTPGEVIVMAILPGLGEIAIIPSYVGTPGSVLGRRCHLVVVEARPGQLLDVFPRNEDPYQRADRILGVVRSVLPSAARRFRRARLTHAEGVAVGAVASAERDPVGYLPRSGRPMLCGGGIAISMDPLGSQDINCGSDFAALCGRAIEEHRGEFTADWMRHVSDLWRVTSAYPARTLTETLLTPPVTMMRLLALARHQPGVADSLVGLYEDPFRLGVVDQLASTGLPSAENRAGYG
jgi:hypothetical protein